MPSVFFVSLMSASTWGGSEELWYRTALAALDKGWKVGCAVYHWKGKEQRMSELAQRGAQVVYLPNRGRSKKNIVERLQNKWSKKLSKKIISALPIEEYDLTVVNMGAFEIITSQWRPLLKKLRQYIVLYHNYKEQEIFSGAARDTIHQLASRAAINLFASRRIAEVLKKNSGIEIENADVLLNPISFTAPQAAIAMPPSLPIKMVVLAALEVDRKAQDLLIDALSSPKWKERDWILSLYGEGRDRGLLQKKIAAYGLEAKIFLRGQTRDVKAVLADAHLLLQLTRQDAMPLSVVETFAVGRPAAVSAVGDMPRWIEDGKNGWISRAIDPIAIDEVLERAWNERDQWELMGSAARRTYERKFVLEPELLLLQKIEEALKA